MAGSVLRGEPDIVTLLRLYLRRLEVAGGLATDLHVDQALARLEPDGVVRQLDDTRPRISAGSRHAVTRRVHDQYYTGAGTRYAPCRRLQDSWRQISRRG
jgi:hypothetical protein